VTRAEPRERVTDLSTYRSKNDPELRVDGQDDPIRIVEVPPALVLGLAFLLTALWTGLMVWGMVKVVELAL
jgi:hypothetical protein